MDFWDQKKSLSTLEMKNMVFLSQKIDGNIFTDYWKVLLLTFSGMGNTVSFWAKKSMERWYLLITEKVLFWTFRWWEIRSFLSQEFDGKMIFTGYWEVLLLNFSVIGNSLFFSQKIDGKIFTWSFWAFHDIPRLRKYGFSRSDLCYRNWETRWKGPLFTNGHTSEGVNNWQFFSRYRVIVVKLKECKIK